MFLCGPLTTTLCEKYGCRVVACVGAFLCVFGLMMSSFARTLEIMYVTYGVTWGLGASFCYFPTLIILVQYFDNRLALVNGLVSSGSGLGTLVISPFSQFILSKVGLFHSLRILALIHVLAFICGLSYKPVKEEFARRQSRNCPKRPVEGKSEKKDTRMSIWRDKAYVAWTIALSTFMLGYFVPFVHLVGFLRNNIYVLSNNIFLLSEVDLGSYIQKQFLKGYHYRVPQMNNDVDGNLLNQDALFN